MEREINLWTILRDEIQGWLANLPTQQQQILNGPWLNL